MVGLGSRRRSDLVFPKVVDEIGDSYCGTANCYAWLVQATPRTRRLLRRHNHHAQRQDLPFVQRPGPALGGLPKVRDFPRISRGR